MIAQSDIDTLERLCDAAARSGDIPLAIEGWGIALRLRTSEAENGRNVTAEPLTAQQVARWEVELGD